MPEKVCWTLFGRKKLFEVDEDNKIIKELDDLGPLTELEFKWVKANSGMAYPEWLLKWEAGELDEDGKLPCASQCDVYPPDCQDAGSGCQKEEIPDDKRSDCNDSKTQDDKERRASEDQ